MKLLLFSDLHSDFRTAARLVELSNDVDVVVGAGDFCNVRRGLEEIIKALSSITKIARLAVFWSAILRPKAFWIYPRTAGVLEVARSEKR